MNKVHKITTECLGWSYSFFYLHPLHQALTSLHSHSGSVWRPTHVPASVSYFCFSMAAFGPSSWIEGMRNSAAKGCLCPSASSKRQVEAVGFPLDVLIHDLLAIKILQQRKINPGITFSWQLFWLYVAKSHYSPLINIPSDLIWIRCFNICAVFLLNSAKMYVK